MYIFSEANVVITGCERCAFIFRYLSSFLTSQIPRVGQYTKFVIHFVPESVGAPATFTLSKLGSSSHLLTDVSNAFFRMLPVAFRLCYGNTITSKELEIMLVPFMKEFSCYPKDKGEFDMVRWNKFKSALRAKERKVERKTSADLGVRDEVVGCDAEACAADVEDVMLAASLPVCVSKQVDNATSHAVDTRPVDLAETNWALDHVSVVRPSVLPGVLVFRSYEPPTSIWKLYEGQSPAWNKDEVEFFEVRKLLPLPPCEVRAAGFKAEAFVVSPVIQQEMLRADPCSFGLRHSCVEVSCAPGYSYIDLGRFNVYFRAVGLVGRAYFSSKRRFLIDDFDSFVVKTKETELQDRNDRIQATLSEDIAIVQRNSRVKEGVG